MNFYTISTVFDIDDEKAAIIGSLNLYELNTSQVSRLLSSVNVESKIDAKIRLFNAEPKVATDMCKSLPGHRQSPPNMKKSPPSRKKSPPSPKSVERRRVV